MQETERRFAGLCSIAGKGWLQDQGQAGDGPGWGKAESVQLVQWVSGAQPGEALFSLLLTVKCSLLGRKQDSQHRNGEEVMGI